MGVFERPDAVPVHTLLGMNGLLDLQAGRVPRRVHVGLGHPFVADDGPVSKSWGRHIGFF